MRKVGEFLEEITRVNPIYNTIHYETSTDDLVDFEEVVNVLKLMLMIGKDFTCNIRSHNGKLQVSFTVDGDEK